MGRPCLAERGLRVETHRFVFGWGLRDSRAPGGYVTRFLGGFFSGDDVAYEKIRSRRRRGVLLCLGSTTIFDIDMHVDIDCRFGIWF